jgi:hypothetical protein
MIQDRVRFNAERIRAAEAAFLSYDFGETEIEATGGWEWTQPGDEVSRPLFLAPLDSNAEATDKAFFNVRFATNESVEVIEAFAITESGSLFGSRAPSANAPLADDTLAASDPD